MFRGAAGLGQHPLHAPTEPVAVGSLVLPTATRDVALSGTFASVAAGGVGLRLVDVSDPAAPVEVGSSPVAGTASGLAASGHLVFVADNGTGGGLRIIDASDPAAPVEVGFAPTPDGQSLDVALTGHLAVVAARYAGLRIIDVSDPAAPVEIGSLPLFFDTDCVATSGHWVWVHATSWNQHHVWLVDISDPAAPVDRGTLELPAVDLAAEGDTAFVATGDGGLAVVSRRVDLFADGFESGDTSAWTSVTP